MQLFRRKGSEVHKAFTRRWLSAFGTARERTFGSAAFTIDLHVSHYSPRALPLCSSGMEVGKALAAGPEDELDDEAVFADPLMTRVPLDHSGKFHPYGFPAVVRSNSQLVLHAAHQSWGDLDRRFAVPAIEIRCLVSAAGAQRLPPPPTVRAQRDVLVAVADASNFWICDMSRGFASAWVTESAVAEMDYFRYHVLEAMAYSLMESLHTIALHAACVALGEHGVLLAGESGAGKSSLAYACARRGWTYITDDASCLLRAGTGRVVLGDSRRFRFRGTAGALFPEFRGCRETIRPRGKPTIEVRTSSVPAIRTACESPVDSIVFLNRRDGRTGRARISPYSRHKAFEYLAWSPWPADLVGEGQRAAIVERLLGAAIYEMRYSDLAAAVDGLERIARGERE